MTFGVVPNPCAISLLALSKEAEDEQTISMDQLATKIKTLFRDRGKVSYDAKVFIPTFLRSLRAHFVAASGTISVNGTFSRAPAPLSTFSLRAKAYM
jgi:hypothetical protein